MYLALQLAITQRCTSLGLTALLQPCETGSGSAQP